MIIRMKEKNRINKYVDFIFRYGLLGCALVGVLLASYFVVIKNKKTRFNIVNLIPILMFLILAIEESLTNSFRCVPLLVLLFVFVS